MIFWLHKEVVHHLGSFRVLNMDVLFFADRLHEVLVHQLPNLPPSFAIVHNQKVVTLSYEISHERGWPVTIYVALLVQKTLYELAIRYYDSGVCETFQTENSTKFPSPFR